MKFLTIKKAILPVIGSIILLFSGCVKDDFDQPPIVTPYYTPAHKVTSIAALQALLGGGSLLEITNDTIIIQGIVTANDESGNIYKSIYIQDNTAGLQVSIERVSMYIKYRIGQRVYIECKGLSLGTYGGVIQLGYNNGGTIGRIPDTMVDGHIFKDSLPGSVEPELINFSADLSGKINKLT